MKTKKLVRCAPRYTSLCLAISAAVAAPVHAQERSLHPTPQALADAVLASFAARDTTAFAALVPLADAVEVVRFAALNQRPTLPGEAAVLRRSEDRAVLYLSGVPAWSNTGDETIVGRGFSGLYEAERGPDGWGIVRRIPPDAANRILSQSLSVDLAPAAGLSITDTLTLQVGDSTGFWAYLNHAARIRSVRLNGTQAAHRFSGALLWIDAPRSQRSELVIAYDIDVARDSVGRANSGRFGPEYGHIRNQYFWTPFFDFHSAGDHAEYGITVRVPAEYHVATSLPQSDTVVGGMRIVSAKSSYPTFAPSLFYDRGWQPVVRRLGGMKVELFITPDYEPTALVLDSALHRTYAVLSSRFGGPTSGYLAVAQGRAREGNGWHFRSNDLIGSGPKGGSLSRGMPLPRYWFGHEVAHGWTNPTGAGANFLTEGWATYAEAVLTEADHGADAVRRFWESNRNSYMRSGFEGNASILEDPNNSGVAYSKGAWILHMLEHMIGRSAFDNGMRAYMAVAPGESASVEEWIRAMSAAAGRDLRAFIEPWLSQTTIPDLRARVEPSRVVIEQHGPLYHLPLEVDLVTDAGTIRRTTEVTGRADTLDTSALGAVSAVHIDPEHRLLIRRHEGETVRFQLSDVPATAEKVELAGDFTGPPIAARRVGDAWLADVPLTAGRYAFWWRVDGGYWDAEGTKLRTVRPLTRVHDAYPR